MLDYETIYVNGQWEIVPDSKPLAVTDPATGEAVGSAPNCSGAVVDLAVAAARKVSSRLRHVSLRGLYEGLR